MNVKEFLLNELQTRNRIEEPILSKNIEELNYVESGFVDSLGLIKFISAIEEHFDIEFSDEEISDDSFHNLGKLIRLIEKKLSI